MPRVQGVGLGGWEVFHHSFLLLRVVPSAQEEKCHSMNMRICSVCAVLHMHTHCTAAQRLICRGAVNKLELLIGFTYVLDTWVYRTVN